MRVFRWVPLLGLLATFAAAQDEALVELADSELSVVPSEVQAQEEQASHKTSESSILETVEAVVASLTNPAAEPLQPVGEEVVQGGNPVEGDVSLSSGAGEGGDDAAEQDGQTTSTTVPETEEPAGGQSTRQEQEEATENKVLSPKERRQVSKYNKVADQVLAVLSRTLSRLEPLPLSLENEVALAALDETIPEPEPEPEPNPDTENKNRRKRRKNKKNRKNKRKDENDSEVEQSERNANRKNKNRRKNKNKNKAVEEEEGEEEVMEAGIEEEAPARKGNKKNNRRKNKNKRKRKNNKRNRRKNNKKAEIQIPREGKSLDMDETAEEEVEDSPTMEQGRRVQNKQKKNKNRRNKNNNNKRKRKNKNKNRRNKKNNKRDAAKAEGKVESREMTGPVYPTLEERQAGNAYLVGLTGLKREGDVSVMSNGNVVTVEANVNVGPLVVQLADKARALTRSQVSTNIDAVMTFKIKSKGRGRQLIKVKDVTVSAPADVSVARNDLPLEPDVVTAAKDEVVQALDVPRLARIFRQELEAIFDKDNLVQNLEDHEFLKL